MPKVRVYDVSREDRYQIVGEFLLAVSKLKTKRDTVGFLVGLLTSSELLMVARRIQIAKSLLKKKSYPEIRKELGVSFQTIAKTEQWLLEGDKDHVKQVRRILLEECERVDKEKKNFVIEYRDILDRYPAHRFWKELFREE